MTILFNTRAISDSAGRDYLRGAASVLNISGKTGREYRFAESENEADAQALANDWVAIGQDLEATVTRYKRHGRVD